MHHVTITTDRLAHVAITSPGCDDAGHPVYRVVAQTDHPDGATVCMQLTRAQLLELVNDAADQHNVHAQPFNDPAEWDELPAVVDGAA